MDEVDLSIFDKLLLEAVFQNEKESQKKETTKEMIQWCTAKCLKEKQKLIDLQNNINTSDETILQLQNYNPENVNTFRRTSILRVLSREEASLQSQLETVRQAAENEKKTYQDSVSQYKEVFRQHQEKYMEFPLSKHYHSIKDELDGIQNSILKLEEQHMTKEKSIADVLGPTQFASLGDWCLQLAHMKKDTNKILEDVSKMTHKSLEMASEVSETEKKIKQINENIENLEKQAKAKSKKKTVTFSSSIINEGRKSLSQSKEPWPKLQLPFPNSIQLSHINNRAGKEEKKNSSSVLSQNQMMEEDIQKPVSNNNAENRESPASKLQPQVHLRLALPQRQIHQKMDISEAETMGLHKQKTAQMPYSEESLGLLEKKTTRMPYSEESLGLLEKKTTRMSYSEEATMGLLEQKTARMPYSEATMGLLEQKTARMPYSEGKRKEQTTTPSDTSKDSGYFSQADSGSFEEMEYQNTEKASQREVFALPTITPCFSVPEIPAPTKNLLHKKAELSNGKKGQKCTKSSAKSHSTPMEQSENSPYFNLFQTSTPKTPNFGSFESPFGLGTFTDQHGSYSSMDTTVSSPVKDFGSIFGKLEGDDDFSFSFTSKPSQSSDGDKEDFGFMLPFSQGVGPSNDSLFKKFTFF